MTSGTTMGGLPTGDERTLPGIKQGLVLLYQFYDIGDEINLDRVQHCLETPTARRYPPVRVRQSESIEIAEPPVGIDLEDVTLELAGMSFTGVLRASIYDLGVVALAMELRLSHSIAWDTVADIFGTFQGLTNDLQERFVTALDNLESVIRPAVSRPQRSPIIEDYVVLVVEQLSDHTADVVENLATHPTMRAALLGEHQPLSASTTSMIASMSYFPDDLALLSWNGALLIESDPLAVTTAVELIEFANVELLLMRTYDAELETQLPQMYRRVVMPLGRFAVPLVRRYSLLLRDVQRLVVEVTEVTERVDNAFKVTDDVYWNRLYSAMLGVLRVRVWRTGVEHRLALLRETYSMLHHEADAERNAALEWAIVLLIVVEIVMALLGLW